MSNEIKEILTNCEKAINEASGYNDTTDKILDYITNLQQLEQEHKKINGELREENSKLEIALQNIQEDYDRRIEENERLKNEPLTNKLGRIDSVVANIYRSNKEKNDYKSRCEKAIEYINCNKQKTICAYGDNEDDDFEICLWEEDIDNLSNILQNGSENDDR